jgi:hypothetical protein
VTTTLPAHQDTGATGGFIIPPPPALCHSEDYENVKVWTKLSWRKYTKDCDDRSRNYQKFDFITDEDGVSVNQERVSAMSQKARQLFNTLYRYRQDPKSWSVKTDEAASFFSNTMRADFPEFRWCENDWKVHAFATEKYPDWAKDVRKPEKGRLTRTIPTLFYQLFSITNRSFRRKSIHPENSDFQAWIRRRWIL